MVRTKVIILRVQQAHVLVRVVCLVDLVLMLRRVSVRQCEAHFWVRALGVTQAHAEALVVWKVEVVLILICSQRANSMADSLSGMGQFVQQRLVKEHAVQTLLAVK